MADAKKYVKDRVPKQMLELFSQANMIKIDEVRTGINISN